jgi:hypothetical protein
VVARLVHGKRLAYALPLMITPTGGWPCMISQWCTGARQFVTRRWSHYLSRCHAGFHLKRVPMTFMRDSYGVGRRGFLAPVMACCCVVAMSQSSYRRSKTTGLQTRSNGAQLNAREQPPVCTMALTVRDLCPTKYSWQAGLRPEKDETLAQFEEAWAEIGLQFGVSGRRIKQVAPPPP